MFDLYDALESGRQVGEVFSYRKGLDVYWSSVGIQKHDGWFKVYIDVISESCMDTQKYELEDHQRFSTAKEAVEYVLSKSKIRLDDLTPCKGQRVFNPTFV